LKNLKQTVKNCEKMADEKDSSKEAKLPPHTQPLFDQLQLLIRLSTDLLEKIPLQSNWAYISGNKEILNRAADAKTIKDCATTVLTIVRGRVISAKVEAELLEGE